MFCSPFTYVVVVTNFNRFSRKIKKQSIQQGNFWGSPIFTGFFLVIRRETAMRQKRKKAKKKKGERLEKRKNIFGKAYGGTRQF